MLALANTFEQTYTVSNSQSLNDDQKQALEKAHNILLPESAFNILLANNCEFPLQFHISNYDDNTQITHVGVQEFSSNENTAIIPNTLMERLSYPNTIRVKYIQLPSVQSIQLQPHNSSFLKQKNNQMYIRNTLTNLSCISIDDTIHVIIENKTYKLNVTNVQPSIFNGVSISDKQYTVKLDIINAIVNDNDDEGNDNCPIESNVNNTKGNDDINNIENDNNETIGDNNTLGGGEDINNDTDTVFNDNESSGDWDDYDSNGIWSDGQHEIPIKDKQLEFTPPPNNELYVPDPNSTCDGNSRKIKPIKTQIDYRAWICEHCHSINNLLDSMKRDYQCVGCAGKYKPGQTIIESKQQDKPLPDKPKYNVWICVCQAFNLLKWNQCDVCGTQKPIEGLITFLTDEMPVPLLGALYKHNLAQGDNAPAYTPPPSREPANAMWSCNKCSWYNNGYDVSCEGCKRPRYGPVKNVKNVQNMYRHNYYGNVSLLGNTKVMSRYPIISNQHTINKRLVDIFGYGYRNSLLLGKNNDTESIRNKWKNKKIGHGIMNINTGLEELCDVHAKSLAINERNGYIAFVSNTWIMVLKPNGCNQFNIAACYSLTGGKNAGVPSRIRFVNNDIYVFDSVSYSIFNYQFDPIQNTITIKQEIYDKYFVEAGVIDFAVTDELLIVLFGRWLGVYKLKPTLEWYHAIAYAQSEDSIPNSIEMSGFDDWENMQIEEKDEEEEEEKRGYEDKNPILLVTKMEYKSSIKHYIFINCANNIIGIHATNPTFDFLHIGNNTQNGVSFCNSRKYGTFWISNEHDQIIQSHVWNHMNTNVVVSLEKKFKFDNFQMIPMDKMDKKEIEIKHISKFNNVIFDEGYGISGRLLINCTVKYNKSESSIFYQLFNHNELLPLKEYLENNDYFLMPGTDFKPFNLIVYVFEMLYGSDLINSLVQSPDFNSVYALPGIDQKNININNKQNKQQEKIENKNKLLNINSKCLIYVNNRWCDGNVSKIFNDENDKECLEIQYIESDDIDLGKITRKVIFDRYNKCLKYNESIPLKDIKTIKWEINDKCLYFDENVEQWIGAEIIDIAYSDNGQKFITILYEKNEKILKYNDVNLYKLDDVVADKMESDDKYDADDDDMDLEQDEGDKNNVAMMNIGVEGPLNQSYIAIKAIGKEKAEIDQDLVFVEDEMDDDMEIEPEGVNENID